MKLPPRSRPSPCPIQTRPTATMTKGTTHRVDATRHLPVAHANRVSDRAQPRRRGRVTVRNDKTHPATRRAAQTEDQKLLERAERPEFLDSDPWRALRILSEFV